MHSLGIVQWNSTRRDHPGNPGGVSGSGPIIFHVSMLRKYIADPSHVLRDQPVELKENLTYEERPVQIVDRKDQVLQNKVIPLVKVLWMNHDREAWEREDR